MDAAHDVIMRAFTVVTTDRMHELWEAEMRGMPNGLLNPYEESASGCHSSSVGVISTRIRNVSAVDPTMSWGRKDLPDWVRLAVKRLTELSSLSPNWDSRGALQIGQDAALDALRVLSEVMLPKVPLPAIVPTVRGGILLEWRHGQKELYIEISPDGGRWVSYESLDTGAEWDGDWPTHHAGVHEVLLHIANSPGGAD